MNRPPGSHGAGAYIFSSFIMAPNQFSHDMLGNGIRGGDHAFIWRKVWFAKPSRTPTTLATSPHSCSIARDHWQRQRVARKSAAQRKPNGLPLKILAMQSGAVPEHAVVRRSR